MHRKSSKFGKILSRPLNVFIFLYFVKSVSEKIQNKSWREIAQLTEIRDVLPVFISKCTLCTQKKTKPLWSPFGKCWRHVGANFRSIIRPKMHSTSIFLHPASGFLTNDSLEAEQS